MRSMDVVLAFPSLILAIAIVTVLGSGPVPGPDRHRASCRSRSMPASCAAPCSPTREQDFVTASRALGESSRGILSRRILPNSMTPLIVARGRSASAGPSSRSPPSRSSASARSRRTAEWGSMIGFDRNLFFSAPHLIFFPGVRHHPDRPRVQPPRRRPARRARPAAEPMTTPHRRRARPSASASTRPSSRSSSRPAPAAQTKPRGDRPLLEVKGLLHVVQDPRRPGSRGRRHRLPRRPRRDHGPRRRVRLRQERDEPVDHAARRQARRRSTRGEILFDGQDLLKLLGRRDAQDPRRPDQHDLPAADVVAQPGLGRRPPDRGGPARSTAG